MWRVVCAAICIPCIVFLAWQGVERTAWNKDRLYRKLVDGPPHKRLAAATSLARVGAENHLLQGIQSRQPEVRELARRGLEHLWFAAAGSKAFTMTDQAYQAMEREDYATALKILNDLVQRYPRFAEGWNRRASLYWQVGEYEKSIADCQRALSLNPNHYGAWQGLGVCHLQLGDLAAACSSLRAALKILPHDEATQRSLRKCEDLLRVYTPPSEASPLYQLL